MAARGPRLRPSQSHRPICVSVISARQWTTPYIIAASMDNPPRYEIGLPTVLCTRTRASIVSPPPIQPCFSHGDSIEDEIVVEISEKRRMRIYTIDRLSPSLPGISF